MSNYEYWAQANRAFGQCVVRQGFGRANMVYGFNAAATELLNAARQKGLHTGLDQTMAPWATVERMLAEERQRWPDWEAHQSPKGWEVLADREAQEWDTADVIICGSSYVIDAMSENGGPVDRCRVVPYGYDGKLQGHEPRPDQPSPVGRRLRVLFLGTVELRKGMPYLMQAAEMLGGQNVEFRVVGPINVSDMALSQLRRVADVRGPVPRSDVSDHYRWADVFLLPTLAEGSANVCYEAMAHGLPVITTPNAGSVVRDGQDGWIIPARSAQAIAVCIEPLVDNREPLQYMGISAHKRAANFTWERYGTELVKAIHSVTKDAPQSQTHPSEVERPSDYAHHR